MAWGILISITMAVAATATALIRFGNVGPILRFLIAAGISSAGYFIVWGLTAVHVTWGLAALAAAIPALVTFGVVIGNTGEEDDGGSGWGILVFFEIIYCVALYVVFDAVGRIHSVFHLYADLGPLIGIPFACTLTKPLVGYLGAGLERIGREGRLAKERVEMEETETAAAFEKEKGRLADAIKKEQGEIAEMIDKATRESKKDGD